MVSGSTVESVLTVVVSIAWIVIVVSWLRRGRSPIGRPPPAVTSRARDALVVTAFFLFWVATECVLALKSGLPIARIGQLLLLRETDFLQESGGLGIAYVVYFFVMVALCLPPRKGANLDNVRGILPPEKSIDVSLAWKERCDRYRGLNRRWKVVAIAWVAVAGVTFAATYRADLPMLENLVWVFAFLIVALAVILMVFTWLPTRLKCPHCDRPPLRHDVELHRWLDDIKECEWCRARLAW